MTRREREAWLAFAVWTLLIFATVPVIRPLQIWISTRIGSAAFAYLTLAGLAAGAVGGIIIVRRSTTRLTLRNVLWLLVVCLAGCFWTLRLWSVPEEAVHLIEYGILGLLAAYALRFRVSDCSLFVQAALVVAIIGVADELLQWVTPRRYFDWRDIRLNAGAGILVQIGLWKGIGWGAGSRLSSSSIRRICRLLAAFLVMVGLALCLSPSAVEALLRRAPVLDFIYDHQDTVVEYGHRHTITGPATFTSRLTLEELARCDRELNLESGAALRASRHSYGNFLHSTSRAQHPFLWETRGHLERRNRNFHLARGAEDETSRSTHATIAWHEDQILEQIYGKTLRAAGLQLGPKQKARLREWADLDKPYEAARPSHMITVASQWQLLTLIALALAALAVIHRWSTARDRSAQEQPPRHQDTKTPGL